MTQVWFEPGAHAVRFYDSAAERYASVAEFLTANPRGGEPLMMIVRRSTFDGVVALLASGRYGAPIPARRIHFVDADEAVRICTDGGVVNLARAEMLLRQAMTDARRLAASDGTLRWYGEGVDVLCDHGDFDAALGVESLADRLLAFDPRTVILCGYDRAPFVNGGAGVPHLHAVYGAHSHVAPIEGGPEVPPQGQQPPPREADGSSRVHIYVIDDDSGIRRSLKRLLGLTERNVRTFENGEAFVAEVAGLAPGVLVIDIQLGAGMSGLDLLAFLKQTRPTWPAIAMSGSDDEDARNEALRLGARVFLRKPFDSQALLTAIADALA